MSSPARHLGPKKRFTVKWVAGGYIVFDPTNQPVSQPVTNHNLALMAAERLERAADARANRLERPCMCCQTAFKSEGPHNRLCDKCRRHLDTDMVPHRIAGRRG